MSIVQDEKELEYWSDQKLLEEAQTPTGRMPLFLIHTQIEKRKNYRDSANARKQTPATSIYEEDVAEFGGGGLGSMQQQMPPPQQMPMSAPPPQAGMGVAPMNRGGQLPEHISLASLSPNAKRGNLTKKRLEEEEKKIRGYKSNLKLSPMARGGLIRAQTGRRLPMENEANQVAAQGRYGDSTLVHMNPIEVAMMNRNGDLTTNPKTGLKEAFAFAPLMPWLAQMGRLGLGYLGRGGIRRSINPRNLPAVVPKGLPRSAGPKGGLPVPSPKALPPPPGGVPPGGGGIKGLWNKFWGGKYGPKAYPKTWGWGGGGLATLPFVLGGGEDELPVNYGGAGGESSSQTPYKEQGLMDIASQYYPEFMQPKGEYQKELSAAESYRTTPEQRKAEAEGIAYSGLAKALSNVGMADIISGVADVTPDVMALRKYQTEEERTIDKNVADLKKMRRGEKLGVAGLAHDWEKTKGQELAYARQMAMQAYQADLEFNLGQGTTYTLQDYIDYYLHGKPLPGMGGGSTQQALDEAGLTE